MDYSNKIKLSIVLEYNQENVIKSIFCALHS